MTSKQDCDSVLAVLYVGQGEIIVRLRDGSTVQNTGLLANDLVSVTEVIWKLFIIPVLGVHQLSATTLEYYIHVAHMYKVR